MNHEWPTAVHKTMIAVDEVTPDAPDLTLISPRMIPGRRSRAVSIAVVVIALGATAGGLAYLLGSDRRDTASPAPTNEQTTVPGPFGQGEACTLLSDSGLSAAEQAALIDHLLETDPSALEPSALQTCKAATIVQLRRLQARVAERQAALNGSTTSAPTPTSAVSTTSLADQPELSFTRVSLSSLPDGYRLLWARYETAGDGATFGMVRYAGPDGTPDLALLIRPWSDGIERLPGRATWNVDGRTIINDGEGSGSCLPDVCSVGVQWDSKTYVSLMWTQSPTGGLGPQHTLESLVALTTDITDTNPPKFVPGVLTER